MNHEILNIRLKQLRRFIFFRTRWLVNQPEKWAYRLGWKSAEGLCLPDFLIIGVQKAGTTWLQNNLDHHPQIFFPRRASDNHPHEVRYFDRDFYLPVTAYHANYADHCAAIKGDKSPVYCALPRNRVQLIRRLMPDVRIVLILRNPIDRAWSYVRMKYYRMKERTVEDLTPAEIDHMLRSTRANANYLDFLDTWSSIFPPEQIYVGFFEQIASDPLGLLRDVCQHIGASTDLDWADFPYNRAIHASPEHPIPPALKARLRAIYQADIERLAARFGDRVEPWLDD